MTGCNEPQRDAWTHTHADAHGSFDFLDDMLTFLVEAVHGLEGQTLAHEQRPVVQQPEQQRNTTNHHQAQKTRHTEQIKASNRQAHRRARLKKQVSCA